MNEEQLQQLAAQHGGIAGRSVVENTRTVRQRQQDRYGGTIEVDVPNPTPHWRVTFNDGTAITVQPERGQDGNPSGTYNVVDWGNLAPNRPSGNQPTPKQEAPATVGSPSTGMMQYTGKDEEGRDTWTWVVPPKDDKPQRTYTLTQLRNGAMVAFDGSTGQVFATGIGPDPDLAEATALANARTRQQMQLDNARYGNEVSQQGFRNTLDLAKFENDLETQSQNRQDAQFNRQVQLQHTLPSQQDEARRRARADQVTEAQNAYTAERDRSKFMWDAGRTAMEDWFKYAPYFPTQQFIDNFTSTLRGQGTFDPGTLVRPAPSMEALRQQGEQRAAGMFPSYQASLAATPYQGRTQAQDDELRAYLTALQPAYVTEPDFLTRLFGSRRAA